MKKIVSLILSLVMLLSITSGLNLTAYADDVNHYLDFQAEIYSSETAGFDNIFVGTDSSSFSRTLYNNLKNDTKFQVTLAAWSSTHIVDDATYTIENNAFKKKDLYDAILFDMIDSTDESTLCQQYQNEFEKLYKMVKNERSSYVIKTADMILGKENYTVEQLKTTDLSEDAKDLLLNGTKYAGVTSVISEVNKILGNVKNAYDAINAVADYLAIKDVDCGTSEILNEIASDSQSPIELRYSAAEISDCMAGAYGKTAALIAEGSISGIEFALNKAINYAWDSVLACIPGGTAISFGAKTGRMLVNYFFKTETVIQGYYQLEAAVNIEDAIIRVMQNKKNADTGYTNIDSAVYMKSVDMYKDIILLGFDYSIELLQNAANSDFNTATDFWLGNYSQCMQLIDQIQELKQKKIDNFVKYEEIVFNKYKSLYLPNYDELEDEISKTVPVTALSVTQLVDINIGDSAYFEDCFAYNFEPYNYTESVTNVSVTSSDSNIISVVKGDDSKEKFVANNAGTCTLTFTLNDRITCQKEVTVGSITSGKCGENVIYSLDTSTGVLTISGTGAMTNYYDENDSPFYNNSNVKSVIIENGVTSIGVGAFTRCRSLTSVTIPDSVRNIGSSAFYGCTSLTSVTIPDSVTSIGYNAFYDCRSLTSVIIPDSVTSIGEYAFYNCVSLTSVTIPNSVTSIGEYTFYNCKSITNVTMPNCVTSIGDYAFYNCRSITCVTIPDSVTSIGTEAFRSCISITDVTIPDSVTSIGTEAFRSCISLTDVTIPDSVSSISLGAFYCCYGLKSVIIGNSVTSIDNSAFRSCIRLTDVTIPDSVSSIGSYAFEDCTSLTIVTISDSVTSIDYEAFYNCKSLTDVYYTGTENEWNKITIDDHNENLTGATIHYNSVPCTENHNYGEWKTIEEATCTKAGLKQRTCSFDGNVQKEEIPAKGHTEVVINGYAATCEKSGLTDGKKCSVCGEVLEAQKEIPKLDHSYIKTVVEPTCTEQGYTIYKCETCGDTKNADYVNAIDHDFSNNAQFCLNGCGKVNPNYVAPDTSTVQTGSCGDNVIYSLNTETGVLTISGTGEMTDSPFSQNSSIKSVIIENGVTSIVTYAFSGCTSLTSITIPDSVVSIGESAFDGCTSLVSVTLSKSITTIEYSTFFGCSSLTSIEIPKSVTTIVNFAFCGCTNLKDVYYAGTQSEWNKINIGHSNEFLTNASLHCSSTPTPEPTPTPTPEPTPTPNPAPHPSTQPTQEAPQQQAAQQTAQQPSVKNDTAAEQVSVAKPKSVSPKKVKSAKKAVSVEWKKVGGIKGYQIQVATDKKFKKNKKTVTVKKQKTTKTTVKKLKAKKKYYVRVRTYKIVNGKKVYSSWSKVKSVKTK